MEQARSSGVRIVGRDAELAAVAGFLDPTAARPVALLVEGAAGIGKTTIVGHALAQAARDGLRLFSARPSAGEKELPYAALGDLLSGVRESSLSQLPEPQRVAIEAALGRKSAAVEEPAVARGLIELVRAEGAEGDLLLAIDDAQWLDRPTASALSFAFRRSGDVPIRVLVARRTDSNSGGDLPLGLADWESVGRLTVGPLSATALGEVLRQRLGLQLPRPRLEALERVSGGNPMFAIELARQTDGERDTEPALSLPGVLAERLSTQDPDTQRALALAAAALRPSTDLLLRAGVGRNELRSALTSGLITLDEDRVRFAHPLLPAVVYERLLPDERREIHGRLARATTDPVEGGHHVARSAIGPDEAGAMILEHAADEAAKLGDHAGAAGFLLRAAELSAELEGDAADRRMVRAASEQMTAGDIGAAASLCRNLIARLPSGTLRASTRQTLVFCAVGPGMSYGDCIDELRLALEDARGDPALEAELHVALSEVFLGTCSLGEAEWHCRRAIELAETVGATTTAVSALALLGFAESMLGLGVTEAARRAFERWGGEADWAATPRMLLASACIPVCRFDEAEELLEQELTMAQERGIEAIEVIARGHLAEVQLRSGRWADALANARVAVEHARQATEPQIVTGTSYSLAMTQALLGLEAARAVASESLAAAESYQDFWFIVSHRAVLGLIALTDDDAEETIDVLEPAWSLMLGRGLGDLSLFPVAQVLGEALVAVRRLDEASAIAGKLHAAPVGAQPWCRAMALRLDALVSAANGDHDSARAAMGITLAIQRDLPEPFELGRSLHLQGRMERSARRWGVARAAFSEALELFDQLGAARWAEKAAADIARLPGRRPGDRRGLTRRESEVAELIASGLANREIAARLFVSVSTVEATLSKVYAKLGVRTRTELAARLSQAGAGRMSGESTN